ncbi:hypothetical protein FGG78_28500 [Thioclava sp. BHET1]|nr:hypothetical protein FGG78_28500 [Thioclava sp. BHET1]
MRSWAEPRSDPWTADPAALELSLQLPAGFGIAPGTAALEITASDGTTGLRRTAREALRLEPAEAGALTLHLADPKGPDLRQLQAMVAEWHGTGAVVSGQISLRFTPCLTHPGMDPEAEISASIRFAPKGPRRALIVPGTPLRAVLDPRDQKIALCP